MFIYYLGILVKSIFLLIFLYSVFYKNFLHIYNSECLFYTLNSGLFSFAIGGILVVSHLFVYLHVVCCCWGKCLPLLLPVNYMRLCFCLYIKRFSERHNQTLLFPTRYERLGRNRGRTDMLEK